MNVTTIGPECQRTIARETYLGGTVLKMKFTVPGKERVGGVALEQATLSATLLWREELSRRFMTLRSLCGLRRVEPVCR